MLSCVYEGNVRHRRVEPVAHEFRYELFMMYFDLEELPQLLEGGLGLSGSWFSPASFCAKDHIGKGERPLADAVRALVICENEQDIRLAVWSASAQCRRDTQQQNHRRHFLHVYSAYRALVSTTTTLAILSGAVAGTVTMALSFSSTVTASFCFG